MFPERRGRPREDESTASVYCIAKTAEAEGDTQGGCGTGLQVGTEPLEGAVGKRHNVPEVSAR